jgi:uncharacterized protein YjbI with pentapeptide repeats
MVSQEHATQTEQLQNRYNTYFGLTGKNLLKFLSSLILPLMLGVFTVVVTFEQQKVARQQRLEDKNDSRQQREQDWKIATLQRETESKVLSDQYRDQVFVTYIKEIGELLKENNGSLTNNALTHTLARVKTLNTIRQLDGSRQPHVIRFLLEARQLTNTDAFVALDISTAELIDIDFHKLRRLLFDAVSLVGVFLQNCTFEEMWLSDVDFSSAELNNVKFSSAGLYNVYFSSARLVKVNFSFARLAKVNFFSARLFDVNFSSARLGNINFSSAWLSNVNFSSAWFDNCNNGSTLFF